MVNISLFTSFLVKIIKLIKFQIKKNILMKKNIQGFDFSDVFKGSDVHKFNELKNLSI